MSDCMVVENTPDLGISINCSDINSTLNSHRLVQVIKFPYWSINFLPPWVLNLLVLQYYNEGLWLVDLCIWCWWTDSIKLLQYCKYAVLRRWAALQLFYCWWAICRYPTGITGICHFSIVNSYLRQFCFQYGACGRLGTVEPVCPVQEQIIGAVYPDRDRQIEATVWYNNQVLCHTHTPHFAHQLHYAFYSHFICLGLLLMPFTMSY